MSLPDPEDLDTGTWIVGVCNSTRSFVGRVIELDFVRQYDDSNKLKEISRHAIGNARTITLFPAFDFFSTVLTRVPIMGKDNKPEMDPTTGMPKMGMNREPIMNAVDFTTWPIPVDLMGHVAIYHLSQMHKQDADAYRSFMKFAMDTQKAFRKHTSALHLPTNQERGEVERQHGGRRS